MSQFSPSDLHLRRQIDEARSAGGWIPWTCTGVALTWWGGAAAYVYGKIGLDATNKWPGETDREWGEPIRMDEATRERVDAIWDRLGL